MAISQEDHQQPEEDLKNPYHLWKKKKKNIWQSLNKTIHCYYWCEMSQN